MRKAAIRIPIFRSVRDRKLNNADSECLASHLLRRTYMVAKVVGEEPRSFDPTVSEWGNLSGFTGYPHSKFSLERVFY